MTSKKTHAKLTTTTVCLSKHTKNQLEYLVEKIGESRTKIVSRAIEKYYEFFIEREQKNV